MTQSSSKFAAFASASNVVPLPKRDSKPAWSVKAAADKTGEVWIYGDIGDSWWGESVTAKAFADELKALGAIDTLNIYINSGGGSVFEGVAIGNILARHKARKIVHVDGLAASIASVIAMAGNEIRMAKNALMMIHNPWGIGMGEAADLRKMAESLDKIKDAIVETYVVRTGGDAEAIMAQMDAETWFTAEEAVKAGFADAISEPVEIAAFAGLNIQNFRRAPETLREATAAAPPEPAPQDQIVTPEPGIPHPRMAQAEARLRRRGLPVAS